MPCLQHKANLKLGIKMKQFILIAPCRLKLKSAQVVALKANCLLGVPNFKTISTELDLKFGIVTKQFVTIVG